MNEQMHESSQADENLTWEVIDLPEIEDSSGGQLWRLIPPWLRGEAWDRQQWRRLGAGGLVLLTLIATLLIIPRRDAPAVLLIPLKASSGCHTQLAAAAAWSRSGASIASVRADGTMQVWNTRTGKCIFASHQPALQARTVAWSPDGRRIASGGRTVDMWDAMTGKHLDVYHVPDEPGIDTVQSLAWSPDGKRLAMGSTDGTVEIWNTSSAIPVVTYQGQVWAVTAVTWSPDGNYLAWGSIDSTVQVWDVRKGTHFLTYRGQRQPVTTVAWSPDGTHLASASLDETVQVWVAATGKYLFTAQQQAQPVTAVAWSPDGARIAVAGFDVQVWAVPLGKQMFHFHGPAFFPINAMTWLHDGKQIATVSIDDTVQTLQVT